MILLSWFCADVGPVTLTGVDLQRVTFMFTSGCVSAAVFSAAPYPHPPSSLCHHGHFCIKTVK